MMNLLSATDAKSDNHDEGNNHLQNINNNDEESNYLHVSQHLYNTQTR
jgi:hypothetical protein